MSISLTPSAANHVQSMLQKRGKGLGLRLGTKASGCSGYAYVVDYADEVRDDDQVFESHGVKVIVDQQSLANLDGMEIDYVTNNILNQGFEFRNPNVKDMCGCGESFNVA
jgi:iron-sulfur cluster assembly protein